MPIPEPRQGESKDDFVKRCMRDDVMKSEYPKEQRAAVCSNTYEEKVNMQVAPISPDEAVNHIGDVNNAKRRKWADFANAAYRAEIESGKSKEEAKKTAIRVANEKFEKSNMKLETKEMKDVEILDVGTWNGLEVTEDMYDDIISNFKNGLIEPYLNIDHNERATEQFRDALKSMSLGFVSDLRKVGKKLVADFKQIPKQVAELIQAGALKKRSVELWLVYKHANGNTYSNVLEAVTFHGANGVPAINTLSDFVKLYKNEVNTHEIKKETITLKEKTEVNGMDTIEVKRSEYEELVSFKASAEHSAEEMAELKSKVDTVSSENEKLKAENEELLTYKEKLQAKEIEIKNKEAEDYVKKQIEEGRIQPKSENLYVKNIKRAKEEGEEALKEYKSDIEERPSILNNYNIENPTSTVTDAAYSDTEEMENLIQAHMKRKGVSWSEARNVLLGEEM